MNTPQDKGTHLILVVDDLPSNLLYFNEALNTFGYQTLTAENGAEAFDKAKGMVPDLILTDVNMPEMNGYQLCESIKTEPATSDIPIILVTAQDDRDSLVRGLDIGADDFLIKPVNLSELQARVRNLLLVKDYRDHMKRYTAELEAEVSHRTEELMTAFDKIKQVNLQLRESTLDTIQRLATAAEYRDDDTAAHIWRMSHYSHVISRTLGKPSDFVDNILYASPMHDVGKIGTPDHILLKKGELTPEERKIMEGHTFIGEQILGESDDPLLIVARKIAGGHHEKWDGTGYPRMLAGEDISEEARIVAVADVYDALTTKRVYKDAWPKDEAFEYIKARSGKHFDPQCVEALMESRNEIVDLMRSSKARDE